LGAVKREKPLDRPDIYTFHDYRTFLKVWFEYLRAYNPDFSLRDLARRAKVSAGYIPLIMSASRKFSRKALQNIVPLLDLNPSEQSYFKLLVELGESESFDTRLAALQRLQRFRDYQQLNPKELEVYRYLSKWYYVAIREMVAIPGFQLDAKWIQKRLSYRVQLGEITRAIAFLVEHKFIQVSDDGTTKVPEKDIDCVDGIYRLLLGHFHKEILGLTADAIESVPREEREIGGYTLAIRKNQFEKLVQIMNSAVEELKNLERATSDPDVIYHVTFAGIPLVNTKADEGAT
jgi:uncharacterized protein (TIGR02147 family)